MHDELFEKLDIVAGYRAGPDVEARERFLRQASAEGHSRSTLKRIAWALLFVAEAVQSHGGSISSTQLMSLLCRRIRLRKPRKRRPAWNGLREYRECRAGGQSAKANVAIEYLDIDVELPGVGEDGMPGRNEQ